MQLVMLASNPEYWSLVYIFQLFASGLKQRGDCDSDPLWGFRVADIKQEVKRTRKLVGNGGTLHSLDWRVILSTSTVTFWGSLFEIAQIYWIVNSFGSEFITSFRK